VTVSWSALFSASEDCQPDRVAVPEIVDGSKAAPDDAAALSLAAVLGGAPVLALGDGVAPLVQALTIRTTIATRTSERRMYVSSHTRPGRRRQSAGTMTR
jgi:hypothetical protein